jgi:hypothetical protein
MSDVEERMFAFRPSGFSSLPTGHERKSRQNAIGTRPETSQRSVSDRTRAAHALEPHARETSAHRHPRLRGNTRRRACKRAVSPPGACNECMRRSAECGGASRSRRPDAAGRSIPWAQWRSIPSPLRVGLDRCGITAFLLGYDESQVALAPVEQGPSTKTLNRAMAMDRRGCIYSHTTTAAARQRAIGPVVRMPRGQTVAHRLLEQLLAARRLSERMVDRVDEFRHRQTMTNRAGFNNRSPTDRARANPCTHTRIQEHLTPIGCSRTVPALQHALSCRATGDTAGPSPLIPRFPVKIPRRSDGRRG